jgi:HEPN domain-containing protein
MTAIEDANYRLLVARRALATAERELVQGQWDVCANYAQLAAETATKAVIEWWEPAIQGHKPADQLLNILTGKTLSPEASNAISELIGDADRVGFQIHIEAVYGNEKAHLTPEQLFDEARARSILDTARRAVQRAEFIISELSKTL